VTHHAMFLALLAAFRMEAVGYLEWLDAICTQKA
jgi:hypothetical protein